MDAKNELLRTLVAAWVGVSMAFVVSLAIFCMVYGFDATMNYAMLFIARAFCFIFVSAVIAAVVLVPIALLGGLIWLSK